VGFTPPHYFHHVQSICLVPCTIKDDIFCIVYIKMANANHNTTISNVPLHVYENLLSPQEQHLLKHVLKIEQDGNNVMKLRQAISTITNIKIIQYSSARENDPKIYKNFACVVILPPMSNTRPNNELLVSYLINRVPVDEHERIELFFAKTNAFNGDYIEPLIFIEILKLFEKHVTKLIQTKNTAVITAKAVYLYKSEEEEHMKTTFEPNIMTYLNNAKQIITENIDKLSKIVDSKDGGSPGVMEPTNEKVVTPYGTRVVYKGKHGTLYVKIKGEYVKLKSLQKSKQN